MYHSCFSTLKQFEYNTTQQKPRTIFHKSSSVPDLACFEQTVSVGSLLLQLGLHHGDLFLGVSHLLLLVVQPLLDLADLGLKVVHLWLQGYPLPLGFLLLVHSFLNDLPGTRRSHRFKSRSGENVSLIYKPSWTSKSQCYQSITRKIASHSIFFCLLNYELYLILTKHSNNLTILYL